MPSSKIVIVCCLVVVIAIIGLLLYFGWVPWLNSIFSKITGGSDIEPDLNQVNSEDNEIDADTQEKLDQLENDMKKISNMSSVSSDNNPLDNEITMEKISVDQDEDEEEEEDDEDVANELMGGINMENNMEPYNADSD